MEITTMSPGLEMLSSASLNGLFIQRNSLGEVSEIQMIRMHHSVSEFRIVELLNFLNLASSLLEFVLELNFSNFESES